MSICPYLAQLLEAYELERLQALVNWLEPDTSLLFNESPIQEKEKETSPMSVITVENSNPDPLSSTAASLDDLIIFSILDEFGPQFMGKPYFQWLSHCVSERFAAKSNSTNV